MSKHTWRVCPVRCPVAEHVIPLRAAFVKSLQLQATARLLTLKPVPLSVYATTMIASVDNDCLVAARAIAACVQLGK